MQASASSTPPFALSHRWKKSSVTGSPPLASCPLTSPWLSDSSTKAQVSHIGQATDSQQVGLAINRYLCSWVVGLQSAAHSSIKDITTEGRILPIRLRSSPTSPPEGSAKSALKGGAGNANMGRHAWHRRPGNLKVLENTRSSHRRTRRWTGEEDIAHRRGLVLQQTQDAYFKTR